MELLSSYEARGDDGCYTIQVAGYACQLACLLSKFRYHRIDLHQQISVLACTTQTDRTQPGRPFRSDIVAASLLFVVHIGIVHFQEIIILGCPSRTALVGKSILATFYSLDLRREAQLSGSLRTRSRQQLHGQRTLSPSQHTTKPIMAQCTPPLSQIVTSLLDVAKRAGSLIISSTSKSATATDTKKNSADLVTETDRAVEKLISSQLLSKYPTFKFMGEETYKPGTALGNEPTFIVDPIDGTTNFVHGYPYVSVSLGFALNKEAMVGVVFNPFTGVVYVGVKGEGSWKADLRFVRGQDGEADGWEMGEKVTLPVREPAPLTSLDGTLVAVEWGSDRSGGNWKCKIDTWARLGRSKEEGGAMVHSARCLGSAALNICAVAEGSIDIYWEGGCWAWDVCAGWVVLTEAGGIIVDGNPPVDGQERWEIPITHRKYLAVRGASSGQQEIVREFWSNIEGSMVYEH